MLSPGVECATDIGEVGLSQTRKMGRTRSHNNHCLHNLDIVVRKGRDGSPYLNLHTRAETRKLWIQHLHRNWFEMNWLLRLESQTLGKWWTNFWAFWFKNFSHETTKICLKIEWTTKLTLIMLWWLQDCWQDNKNW